MSPAFVGRRELLAPLCDHLTFEFATKLNLPLLLAHGRLRVRRDPADVARDGRLPVDAPVTGRLQKNPFLSHRQLPRRLLLNPAARRSVVSRSCASARSGSMTHVCIRSASACHVMSAVG